MSSDPVGVAIVTGGSSGIGLAVTNHLISKKWHVFILDLQPPLEPTQPEYSTFIKTNVTQWEENAAAFDQAYDKFSRLDFVALNAGIDDRDDIFNSISQDRAKPPTKPNLLPFEINLHAPYYGIKLAAHYMSLNPAPATQGGKIVITGSAASFWTHPILPQYSATKYGVLGLTRAMGPAADRVNIRVNCVCPATIATPLAPAGLLDKFPKETLTPMSTLIRAYDEVVDFDGLAKEGRAKWVAKGHNGAAVLVDRGNLVYKKEDENTLGFGHDPAIWKAWIDAYVGRNIKYGQKGA